MSKLLILLVAVLVFFWLLRGALTGRKSKGTAAGASPDAGATPPATALVSCAHCGVLVPQEEAIASGEDAPPEGRRFFCSREHQGLGPR